MRRPLLLDLFCGAGGAAMGYHRAGFDVIGVDLAPQKNYPFTFEQADALDYLREEIRFSGRKVDVVHASPPCQRFSAMTRGRWQDRAALHLDLVGPTRELLATLGVPFVIENVEGSPLVAPVKLCGTMFGLGTSEGAQLRRHRMFECSWPLVHALRCAHNDGSPIGVYGGGQHPARRRPATIGVWGNAGGFSVRDQVEHWGVAARREAMGVDWMRGKSLSQAIPPAYTEYLGKQLLAHLASKSEAA